MTLNHHTIIARELGIKELQVNNTVSLLDDGNTVPFIARYRKEMTGSLDEEQIQHIGDRIAYLRMLDDRKAVVLKSIEEQGKLTPELAEKIRAATKLQEVEDLYLPYRPKRRTRATIARERGLEPLAQMILDQDITEGDLMEMATQFIDPEKEVTTPEEALAGARDIVAEIVSDDADVRKLTREYTFENGFLNSEARTPGAVGDYELYAEFSAKLDKIKPHQMLAINRGEREDFLRVTLDLETAPILVDITARYTVNVESIFIDQLRLAVGDGYQRLIAPAIEREIRRQVTEKSDEHAIQVFATNLRNLLMGSPMKDATIIGIDPGFRTGCKVAVIDATGKYLHGTTIYPHEPQGAWEDSRETLLDLAEDHDADIIAIGNGTASRETERLVAEVIEDYDGELVYTIVDEAGASVYSASKTAREEFPDLDASMRGNISIARRLLDPLSELVKIDPKSIGVGLYQHDVNQSNLSKALERVVGSCVNNVGVNLNTASRSLLRYVAGINSRIAESIVHYREEKGRFQSRGELMDVKGMGPSAFTQAAGFLRIPGSDAFFDATAVHPESYPAAEKLLELLKLSVADIRESGAVIKQRVREKRLSIESLAGQCGVGVPTMEDIIDSLEKPNRDPRDSMPKPVFRSDVLTMEDLKEGMKLKGTVRNVVDFGAFVDIGVKQAGLVHVSEMADRFVKNPLDIVSAGDVVDVYVLKVDVKRGRIGLSMKGKGD